MAIPFKSDIEIDNLYTGKIQSRGYAAVPMSVEYTNVDNPSPRVQISSYNLPIYEDGWTEDDINEMNKQNVDIMLIFNNNSQAITLSNIFRLDKNTNKLSIVVSSFGTFSYSIERMIDIDAQQATFLCKRFNLVGGEITTNGSLQIYGNSPLSLYAENTITLDAENSIILKNDGVERVKLNADGFFYDDQEIATVKYKHDFLISRTGNVQVAFWISIIDESSLSYEERNTDSPYTAYYLYKIFQKYFSLYGSNKGTIAPCIGNISGNYHTMISVTYVDHGMQESTRYYKISLDSGFGDGYTFYTHDDNISYTEYIQKIC